jgi:hypothetical protein
MWDDSCGNIVVAVQGKIYDFEKQVLDSEAYVSDVFSHTWHLGMTWIMTSL